MSYREKFNIILKTSIKGWGIGLILAIAVGYFFTHKFGDSDLKITLITIFGFTPAFGISLSMALYGFDIYQDGKLEELMEGSLLGIIGSFFSAAAGSLFGACILLLFGFIFLIPCVAYIAVLYVIHFIFYGIMARIESKGKLKNMKKALLIEKLLGIIPIVIGIYVLIKTLIEF